jgi:outer membrane protein OmpA-like peptidoglycan-associated protein
MRLLKWAIIVALTVGVFWAVIPQATQWYIQSQLQAQGLQPQIRDLRVDYVSGEFIINGLEIRRGSQVLVRADTLRVAPDLGAWWQSRLVVRKWHSQGLQINLTQTDKGLELPGFTLPMLSSRFDLSKGILFQLVVAAETRICRKSAQLDQCLNLGDVQLGDTLLRQEKSGWQLSSRSPWLLDRVNLRDQQKAIAVFFIQKALLRDLVVSSDWSRVAQVQLNGLHLVERSLDEQKALENPYQTQVGSLLLNDLAYKSGAPSQLHVGQMEVISLRQTLHKNREQVLVATAQLREFFPLLDKLLNPAGQLTLSLGKTRILDGALAWLDDSVQPAVRESLSGLNCELSSLNTLKPDEATQLTLVTKLSGRGEVHLRGTVRPFAQPQALDLQGTLRDIDLTHYGSYAQTYFGEVPRHGVLDGSFDLNLGYDRFKLQGRAVLTEIRMSGDGLVTRQGVDMTLGRAFERLRGDGQQVTSEWVFEQDLTQAKEPLRQLMANSFKANFVRQALNGAKPSSRFMPGVETQLATVNTFDPFRFNPNEKELSPDQLRRMDTLVQLIKTQPKVQVKLCATATAMEWAALYNQGVVPAPGSLVSEGQLQYLQDLSAARTRFVKTQLQNRGIPAGRFVACESDVQMASKIMSYLQVVLDTP